MRRGPGRAVRPAPTRDGRRTLAGVSRGRRPCPPSGRPFRTTPPRA